MNPTHPFQRMVEIDTAVESSLLLLVLVGDLVDHTIQQRAPYTIQKEPSTLSPSLNGRLRWPGCGGTCAMINHSCSFW